MTAARFFGDSFPASFPHGVNEPPYPVRSFLPGKPDLVIFTGKGVELRGWRSVKEPIMLYSTRLDRELRYPLESFHPGMLKTQYT